jgi:repressor LexA
MGRRASTTPSKKQLEILSFIEKYIKDFGYPPAIRDICVAVDLSSSSTVFTHLNKLEKMGFIERDESKTRSIRLARSKFPSVSYDMVKINDDEKAESITVPVIGKVTAGLPILAHESIERTFPVPLDFLNDDGFMLRVSGDSMIEAGILDGDYILVQKQSTAEDGDIVVALIEDEATVKRFYKEKDYFRLQPENRYMKAIFVTDLSILGKVVGVFRKL